VYSAANQSQKEKYEMDLKKEIKKLQRLRDQIKSWIGSNDVKDKEPLIEARKLIETKMEAFKTCEKETKTKTYSKEGLARGEQLTPEERAKEATCDWITTIIEQLMEKVQEAEVEIEKLSAGKGKKTNKHQIDDFNHYILQHKYHLSKLEGIMRLVNNDVLDVDAVDPIKEDLEYYIDSFNDDDYQQAYDEDFFYEALGLDELQVVNVDRVTVPAPVPNTKTKVADQDETSKSSKGSSKDTRKSKVAAAGTVIPLTIGRARVSSKGSSVKGEKGSHHRDSSMSSAHSDDDSTGRNTPSKGGGGGGSIGSSGSRGRDAVLTPTTIPAAPRPSVAQPTPTNNAPGTSMAAILKRETEQQEKERQQKVCL
jgi:CCR4-NOT transcription complex subunit 3